MVMIEQEVMISCNQQSEWYEVEYEVMISCNQQSG